MKALALLSVLWTRAYRLADNLLTGAPACGRPPTRPTVDTHGGDQ